MWEVDFYNIILGVHSITEKRKKASYYEERKKESDLIGLASASTSLPTLKGPGSFF